MNNLNKKLITTAFLISVSIIRLKASYVDGVFIPDESTLSFTRIDHALPRNNGSTNTF